MANGPSFFGENTPDYGLSQDIIRLLGLSPEGHIGGDKTYHKEDSGLFGIGSGTLETTHDHGIFNPFNEASIITALAKKYGLSAEEQANLFKPGMFQPLTRSMTQMLNPQQYRTELAQGQTADPSIFSAQLSSGSGMAGSGSAQKRAMEARQALMKKRAGNIAEMSGNILGQKDSILQQIQAWDTAAKEAAGGAGVGQFEEEDDGWYLGKNVGAERGWWKSDD
jgi:hypothetical protein